MSDVEGTPIVINNKEYIFEEMTAKQQRLVNHITDLAGKIQSTKFNLEQLEFARQAFVNSLLEDIKE